MSLGTDLRFLFSLGREVEISFRTAENGQVVATILEREKRHAFGGYFPATAWADALGHLFAIHPDRTIASDVALFVSMVRPEGRRGDESPETGAMVRVLARIGATVIFGRVEPRDPLARVRWTTGGHHVREAPEMDIDLSASAGNLAAQSMRYRYVPEVTRALDFVPFGRMLEDPKSIESAWIDAVLEVGSDESRGER